MVNKLMYMMHKINSSVDFNQWLKCFDTQLNEPTNKNSTEAPKVVKPTYKNTLSYNFGVLYNKQPNFPFLPG